MTSLPLHIYSNSMKNYFIWLSFILFTIATVSESLSFAFCRLNNPIYHTFEVIMVIGYVMSAGIIAYSAYPVRIKWKYFSKWLIVFALIRAGSFNPTWGYVAYKNPLYLGDGAWTDRLIKTVLFDWMNQGTGALGFIYCICFAWGFLMFLNIYFNFKNYQK